MGQPGVYASAHSFVADSANIPDFPGQNIDVELAAIAATFAQYHTNIALIQRDDGALKNGIVTADSLDAVLTSALANLISTASDVILTHADVALTHADVVLTHADVVTAAASVAAAAASAAATGISGLTNHGIPVANTATSLNASIALTDGQLIVGATGANPTAKTLTGDVTLTAAGVTAIKSSVSLTTPVLGVAAATSINKVTITPPATGSTITVADGKTATISNTLTISGTDASTLAVGVGGTLTGSSSAAVFYDNVPQNSQNAGYTLVLSDAQKLINMASAGAFTIPANASVAFPVGTCVTWYNPSAACTIAITSDTLRHPTLGTGTRTIAQFGLATMTKVAAAVWVINGAGLT